ncbi:chromosome transmission fidelity protein 18 homolog isoform X2 [Phalaenopsis equestris]|uniref:chromosome transmission fidelity protein 18 homolog isoform X2 n=1 Tax=Phalaenopsis equestris TaxID=78828 RepID=UPI0009E3385D|nr:chromosome transmission fidelity protein 18 homolog isoform X2 [Phalaenopsis equestris]
MDKEQLIPHAEELEWLETNSFLAECVEVDGFSFDDEEIGEDNEGVIASAALPHADPREIQGNRKRVWSEENDGSENIGEIGKKQENGIKRRALELVEEEQDEGWLQYCPPQRKAVHIAPESDHLMAEVPFQEKIISRFALEIEGDCVPVTGPYGDRVYAKMQSCNIAGEGPKKLRIEHPKDGLLSEPISIILKNMDNDIFSKAFEEKVHSPFQLTHSEVPTFSEKLWAEKYAPCSFTELLSDEQTNREVLLWLKQWDSSVFGSQVRLTTDDVLSALRCHSTIQHKKISDGNTIFEQGKSPFSHQKFKPWNAPDRQNENLNGSSASWNKKATVDHPPEQKVLLLCGPPGLGKTTLAHVAAKHCGYRVVEINASDDRSSSTLESKILDAVQMTSVISDSKPRCLVIDEIDGALGDGKGAVEVILKMVAADKKANFEKSNSTQQSLSEFSSKRVKKSFTLLRPVICICNDLYAPALRPLRQIAKVHMFVQPTISRVVYRLRYICQKEGLKINSIALAALAEYTECDIRSCLNTLQFLNKKKETLNILEIGSQVVGHKDISRSCFDIWNKIFQNSKSKCAKSSKRDLNGQRDFEFMYSLLSNHVNYDLTMDGIHENILGLSYIDPMMTKTFTCLDMLGVSDLFHQYIMRTQQMSLHVFQPPLAIAIKRLIALVDKPNIEWPKSLQRCRAMSMEKKDMLKFWQSKLLPIVSRHLSAEYFAEDFVSLFLHILVPPNLRPVALHLFSEKEKHDVAQLVDTMASYSITYKSSNAENLKGPHKQGAADDASILTLDPPIGDFINFKDYQSTHLGLSLTMKRVLLHEVEKQRIMRENPGRSLNPSDECGEDRQSSTIKKSEVIHERITKSASVQDNDKPRFAMIELQNKDSHENSNSEIKKIASDKSFAVQTIGGDSKKPSRPTSFFDRFRQGCNTDSKNDASNLQKAPTAERDSRPFLFKYNEGFTNAVKRSVKVRELLF